LGLKKVREQIQRTSRDRCRRVVVQKHAGVTCKLGRVLGLHDLVLNAEKNASRRGPRGEGWVLHVWDVQGDVRASWGTRWRGPRWESGHGSG